MKRKTLLSLLTLLFAGIAFAQTLPRKSPYATVSQRIGLTEVSLEYSRPQVKDRTIWGEVVAYDKVWRTGANEATVIEFQHAAFIEDKLVPAGRYALFTVPGKDAFKIILNTEADQFGAYNHDPKLDLVTFNVPTQTTSKTEFLTFSFENHAYDKADFCLAWDEAKVCMEIKTRANEESLKEIEKMLSEAKEGDYSMHIRATRFAIENNVMLDRAAKWADTAVEVSGGKYDALWFRASLYAAAEDYDNAVATAEKTLAAIPDDNERWKNYVKDSIAEWEEKR